MLRQATQLRIGVDYEIATGLSEKDEKIRVATLRGVMGKDCYNIYKRLPLDNNSTFDSLP